MNTFCADCCGWHPVEDDCVMKILDRFEAWLRRRLTFRELGWEEIGEKFTRFVLFKCRWFSVYLHKLDSPVENLKCHDHPWHFWAFVLWGGYFEEMGCQTAWRPAGSVLYRTASPQHRHPAGVAELVDRRRVS